MSQHMQKALEQMNVKLTEVVSRHHRADRHADHRRHPDGRTRPRVLARCAIPNVINDEETIALALEGTWRPEHLFELRQAYELYQFHHRQITECDRRDPRPNWPNSPTVPGRSRTRSSRGSAGARATTSRFEATGLLFQALGVDLTLIEGIDVGTALVILAEIGVDVSRFPTEKHFASWLRRLPPADTRATRRRRRRGHRKGTNRVTIALRMAARPWAGRNRRWACSTDASAAGSAAWEPSRRRRTSWRVWSIGCSSTARST